MKVLQFYSGLHASRSSGSRIEIGGQGAKFLVMALCLGSGGQRSCFGTCLHMRKVKNWGQGAMAPEPHWIRYCPVHICMIPHFVFHLSLTPPSDTETNDYVPYCLYFSHATAF